MSEIKEYKSPIHLLKLSTPDFVWQWYEDKFKAAVKEHTKGEISNEYKSFMGSLQRYRDGERRASSMVRLNVYFRRIMERVFPIAIPDHFFIGNEEQMENEAKATARRMIKNYEKEYERQIRDAEVA